MCIAYAFPHSKREKKKEKEKPAELKLGKSESQ